MLSYDDAIVRVTAPGERFETTEVEIRGVTYTIFRNAPASLRDIVATTRDRGDAVFLVYENERWTFSEFADKVAGLATALVERYGIKKGDRVAIGMRNYPEWVVAFSAITAIGAISVSLNAWWTSEELDYALSDCGAGVLIADHERIERGHETCERLGIRVVAVRAPDAPAHHADQWDDLVVSGATMPEVAVDPDDDATILYTSGTTGHPKGAVSTHRAVVQALMGFGCRTAADRLRNPDAPRGTDPLAFILVVPLFHVTGCVPVMLSCLSSGLRLVIMYKWDPDRALVLIERERVTNFVGVPTQSWDLLASPHFAEHDTSSLRSVGGGGAPAPPELVRRVASSFAKASPGIGYGMTETNAYGPQNGGADYLSHPTSTGRATPILEVEVRDEEGKAVPAGEIGEIWFKGPNLIRGYWGNDDATAEVIVDGWLRSGDLGRIDDEGFVYVEDRAKDMVLRAGENVYSAEVEAVLYEHPAVHEAAVFGLPHDRLGEEVAAVVLPRTGAQVTVAELQHHVREHLAPFKVPTRMTIVDIALPRNAAGKILKRELRDDLIRSGESSSPSTAPGSRA
ncbi:MAG TPA: class I adenylate-forming enzyme family protein [Acidimicrobiales bacterium]|jgi:long-chain acyl-CoA synthetase